MQGVGSVRIAGNGAITIIGSLNNTLAAGTLVVVADSACLHDGTPNKLSDPCNGLFTVRTATVKVLN